MHVNKKGSVLDMIIISIFILAFFFALLISFTVLTEFQKKSDSSLSPAGKDIINKGSKAFQKFDSLFGALVILSGIAVIITVFFIPSHPVFFAASFIAFILTFVIFWTVQQATLEVTNTTVLQNATDTFQKSYKFMDKWIMVGLIFGALVLLVIAAKNVFSNQGGQV